MSEKENKKSKFSSAGKWGCRLFALLLLCPILLVGCGVSDKALSFTLNTSEESKVSGENKALREGNALQEIIALQESNDLQQSMTEAGSQDRTAGQSNEYAEAAEEETILVHVCGAVNNPGVVELPEDSRAEDALAAAGGLREDAQPDYVNLAAKVEDGQKLYFPTKGEAEALVVESRNAANALVNINTAGEEQLCTLPGIGASRAGDIVAYREAHGAFQSKEDIMKVSGIKQSIYEKLCEQITIE